MTKQIRRRKEMAVRVRDFSHAHPSADPSFVSILGRLEESINQLVELEGQQTTASSRSTRPRSGGGASGAAARGAAAAPR